jgi:hypothetical protein
LKPILNAAVLILLGSCVSNAQEVDAYAGLGTARASSNGQQIDTFGDNTLHATPAMGGTFLDFGINVFFNKQWGAGPRLAASRKPLARSLRVASRGRFNNPPLEFVHLVRPEVGQTIAFCRLSPARSHTPRA